ncbi:hypothetical protein AM501_13920 [Aneurinibacillus migulanus]|uniref:FecR family protein n=1 Tax=Aneurinibacillus migulanus TaxID=47500 RepID=UPI0006B50802|nr:FecR domain-containing protein [Aneurinibacillus migulanus]KPD07727.1 hypothetical protein AM501_13920 [Aneurinibacillus migulanus]
MRIVKSFLSLLLIMAVIIPGFAQAKDTQKVGKITAVSGSTEVKKSGGKKQVKAFKSMAITQGDTIITGRNGKVNMDLDSDKEVIIGPNTKLVISQLVQNARAMSGKTSMSLLGGSVMVKVKKKLTGDSRFEIKTPTAIMGVMGTQFVMKYERNTSFIGVIEGTVAVSKLDGTPGPSVHANEQAYVNPSGDGVPEALNLNNLPLFALEQYAEDIEHMLENNPNPDLQALKERIEKVRKEKQQAQDDEQEGEEQPETSTIIHEGTSPSRDKSDRGSSGGGGGGGGDNPTPVAKPTVVSQGAFHPTPNQRTDLSIELALAGDSLKEIFYSTGERVLEEGTDYRLESGTQSGRQTIVVLSSFLQDGIGDRNSFDLKLTFTSGYTLLVTVKAREVKSPQLDTEEFYNNMHVYVPNNRTFILPFTTSIKSNVVDELTENDISVLRNGTNLWRNDDGRNKHDWTENDRITTEGNQLKIELENGVAIGKSVEVYVAENTLKNTQTDDIQEEAGFVEFSLAPFATPDSIKVDPNSSKDIVINITSFGYPFDRLELEGGSLEENDYEISPAGSNLMVLKLTPHLIGRLYGQRFTLLTYFRDEVGGGEYPISIELQFPW